jgi:hypothetical protein
LKDNLTYPQCFMFWCLSILTAIFIDTSSWRTSELQVILSIIKKGYWNVEKIFASTSNKKYIKISDTCSVNNLGGVLVGMFVWSTVKFCTCVLSKLRKINPKNKLNILEFISNRFVYQITMRELSPFPMLNGIEYTQINIFLGEHYIIVRI